MTADDLIDFTPELRAEALELVKQYKIGPLFTPPAVKTDTIKGTVQLPGSVGGADWQGGAFDKDTGILYVQSITAPFVADILKGDPQKHQSRLCAGAARVSARAARIAAAQAALWPHHRDRSEHGRASSGPSQTATGRAIIRC